MSRFITSLIVVVLAGVLQSSSWFQVAGVKPDLVLVLVPIFFMILGTDWIERLALVLSAELSLQFAPVPGIHDFAFIAVLVASGILMDYVRLQPRAILSIIIILATAILGAFGGTQWLVTLEETIFNLILVLTIYTLIEFLYGKKLFSR